MTKDLFKAFEFHHIGPGVLGCPCCDSKLSHKRKSKVNKNCFSQLKRAKLKNDLIKELEQWI